MQKISMFPIYPDPAGTIVQIPAGAKLLSVSLNVHQYYLHVLSDAGYVGFENRVVYAYKDEDLRVPDGDLGVYLGNCSQSGEFRRWHFFDKGVAQVGGPV